MWHTKRPILFRGINANGDYVFGDLISAESSPVIHYGSGNYTHVSPASVSQLCGFDINGLKVFEGDLLLDDFEQEHIAEIFDRPSLLATLTLKE